MKLTINLTQESIDSAIKELKSYEQKLSKIKYEIAEELANLGVEIVDQNYMLANEDKIVDVRPVKTDFGYAVVATGENVMFLEFGAGVDTMDYEHEPIDAEIRAGAWSETEGKGIFAQYGHWHYRGIDYTGTPATMGFYFAREEIAKEAQRIAMEVLNRYD